MTASQIIGKSTAKWFTNHGILESSEQQFDNYRSLLVYLKTVYLDRNIQTMTEHEKAEIINSGLEGVAEIIARRLLRGE